MATDVTSVIFIGGRSGVGKTTAAAEASRILTLADVHHAVIEGDYLDYAHPAPWKNGIDLAEQNLAAVWKNYFQHGYRRLIYTNTVSIMEVEKLSQAIGGRVEAFPILLDASDTTVASRLARRESGESFDEHFERSTRAAQDLRRNCNAHVIDTNGRTSLEVAREMLFAAGWAA